MHFKIKRYTALLLYNESYALEAASMEEIKNERRTLQTYDEMSYWTNAQAQTHPSQLAPLAMLFGMTPAPVDKCRILELGCGNGGNLVPMAARLPNSQFVGIDLSQQEVLNAHAFIKALGLTNIEIKHGDIMQVDRTFGQFDYIIAHGVYSWVPSVVRQKILAICRENLAPQGIAYVSYNAYPGSHFKQMVREMMLYHLRDVKHVQEAISSARQFMQQLLQSIPEKNSLYGTVLKQEAEDMKRWRDTYIGHDLLEENNTPYYFHEFMAAAEKEKLQFLSDADFHTMIPSHLPPEALAFLSQQAPDIVVREQYMDFMTGRMFRETLLCHRDVHLQREMKAEHMLDFYFSSALAPIESNPNVHSDKKEKFRMMSGVVITAKEPLLKAILQFLSRQWPKPASFKDLLLGVQLILKKDQPIPVENMLAQLWWGYSTGVFKMFSLAIPMVLQVSERPEASPVVRHEVKSKLIVTNQMHDPVKVDAFCQHLIPLLVGKHTVVELADLMLPMAVAGKFKLEQHGKLITDQARLKKRIGEEINTALPRFARLGFLIN